MDQTDDSVVKSPIVQDNEVTYIVNVKTGDIAGAGTDANVFIILYGKNGDTGKITLDCGKADTQKIFEKDHDDKFTVTADDVGRLYKIRIGHDNKGRFAGWYLDSVNIVIPFHDYTLNIPATRWLSKTEADNEIEVELYPLADEKVDNEGEIIKYHITVKTGDFQFAGTYATVFIWLFGEKGDTGRITLDTPDGDRKTIFEQNQNDIFTVEAIDVGTITKIRIGHDNTGPFAGWYLDKVNINIPYHDSSLSFLATRWLSKTEADNEVEVDLFPLTSDDKAQKRIYDIHVKTADVMFAGTDANVFITLYGEDDNTPKINLDTSKTHESPFERDQIDTFTVEELNVGNILKIRIGHDGTGVGPGWYLVDVMVQSPDTKHKWYFLAERWLDRKTGDGKLEVDIFPTSR